MGEVCLLANLSHPVKDEEKLFSSLLATFSFFFSVDTSTASAQGMSEDAARVPLPGSVACEGETQARKSPEAAPGNSFGKFPLVTAVPLAPDMLMLWVDSEETAEKLLKQSTLAINDFLTLKFRRLTAQQPSNVLLVRPIDSSQDLAEILPQLETLLTDESITYSIANAGAAAYLFSRSVEEASSTEELLNSFFSVRQQFIIQQLLASSFKLCTGLYTGIVSFSEASLSLQKRSVSMFDLLHQKWAVWPLHIRSRPNLALREKGISGGKIVEEVVVVCHSSEEQALAAVHGSSVSLTEYEVDAVISFFHIKGSNYSISQKHEGESKNVEEKLKPFHACVLWDFDGSPLHAPQAESAIARGEIDLVAGECAKRISTLSKNIQSAITQYVEHNKISNDDLENKPDVVIQKMLFTCQSDLLVDDPNQLRGLEMQQIIRANMLKAAVAQQFEVIPCSDASIDSLIRETLQDRLSLFRLRNELVEPVVCGIVEGSLFSSLVPFLKLDGFDDIIYVYNSKNIPLETVPSLEGLDETSDTMISKLVRYSFPWSYLCGGQRGMTKLRTYLRETFTGNSRGNSGSILHLSSSSSNILPTSSVELDTISNSHVDLDYESSLRRESNSSSWSMSSASRIISPKNPTSFSTKKCLLLKQWREHYESISRIGTNESLSNRTDPVMHSKQVGTLQHVVDLKCFGVAVYFQKLMAWRSVALHRQRHQQVKRGQRKQSSAQFELDSFLEEEDDFSEVDFDTLPPMTNYFAPLLFHEECDSGYIGEEDKCNLKVVMDTENRRYELIVKGTNVEALHRRCKRLTQMVAEALANRQTHLLPNWKTEQYMCLNSSGVIAAHELRSKAIVIFRNAGEKSSSRTVAEIVALQSRCHNKLWGYIEKLVPLSMSWNIPQSSVTAFTDTDWENFRYKYAVNVGKCTLIELTHGSAGEGASSEAQGDDGKKLPASMQLSCKYLHFEKVWGFHGLLDEALKFLLSGFSERNSPEIPDGVMQTFSKVSIRALNAEESISPSKAPSVGVATLSSLVESVAKNKPVTLKGNRNSKGSYLFQDREAGIFFTSFETEFKEFLTRSFNVVVDVSSDAVDAKKQSGQEVRTPAVKVTYEGSSSKETALVRNYLEQINTTNLVRHQIYFPRTTSDRYKDLHNVKSKQTNKVAGIRRDEMDKLTKTGTNLSTISESSPPLVDPMRCCGFINIRLKPPLHSKGIKRMALPADTVVTVSGSILVDGQEELIKSVRTAFENCESDYIVRTLTLPATAPLAKTLTVRSTREKFILEHNLVGLRWEEGGRHNDFVGTAKVWAFNLDDMFRVIQEFRSNAENFVTNDASNQPVADGSDATISISDKAESFKTMDGQANAFHVSANPQQMTPMLQSLSFDGNMAIDSSNFATLDSIDLPVPPGLPAIKPVPQRAFSWTSSQPVSNSVYTTLQPDGVTVNAAPRPKSDTILGLNLNGVHELFSSGDALDGIRELRSEQTSQHLFSRNLFEVEQVEDKIGLRHNPKLQEFNGKGYNPVSGFGTSGRSFSSHQSPVDPRTSYFFAPPYAHSASPAGIPRAQSYDPRQGYGSTSLSSVSRFTSIDTQELQGPSYGDVLASSSSSTDHFGRSSVRQGGFVPHQSHPLDVNTSTWKNSGVARTTTTIAHPSRRSEAISYDMNTGCTMKSNSSLATSYFAGRKETLASRSSDFASSSLSGRYSSGHTSIDRFDTPSGGFYSDDSIGFRSKQELPNTPHSHLHGVSRKGHFPIDSQETTSRPTPAFFPGVLDGRTQKHWPEQYSYDSKLPSAANNYTAQSADQYSSGQHQQCNPSGMFSGGERRHLPSQPQGDFTTSYVYNPYGSGRPQDNNGSRRY